jgi:hypothetical protein
LRAQTVSPASGWRWLAEGFAIFHRNPPVLSLLVTTYWLTLIFLNLLPVFGPAIVALIVPGLSVGLMQAARNIERGQAADIRTLLGGLRDNTRTLLALGALFLTVELGILVLAMLLGGDDLRHALQAASPDERAAALANGHFALPGLFVALMLVPVLMAWWFAPVLAAWHRQPLAKALFFSFVACWMNWRAFLAYGATLVLAVGLAPTVLLSLLELLFPGIVDFVRALLIALILLAVTPAIFASFYVSYRDIFGVSEIV